jgi:hypothetical protein
MFEIRFAADKELMELIQWMKSHLSHKYPKGASFLEIFKFAIKYLKQREDLSIQKKPRNASAKTNTRYIPKSVKQQVWRKYNGKCSFVGSNNKRCNSDYNLQYDHHPVPYARGGPSTANNLRLLCARHNRFTAEKVYGEQAIKKHYIKESPGPYGKSPRLAEAWPTYGVGRPRGPMRNRDDKALLVGLDSCLVKSVPEGSLCTSLKVYSAWPHSCFSPG